MVKQWVSRTREYRFEADPNYYKVAAVKVAQNITAKLYISIATNARVRQMESGEI